MTTFNPETNFSPDAAGARPRGDPVVGSLRSANLMSGPRVWVSPEGPQPTCAVARARLALPGKHYYLSAN